VTSTSDLLISESNQFIRVLTYT